LGFCLVDGYNVVLRHFSEVCSRHGLSSARQSFVEKLRSNLGKLRYDEVIVVFDSREPEFSRTGLTSARLRVVFAPPPSADEWLIQAVGKPGRWTVVTDDAAVRRATSLSGVSHMSSDRFMGLLDQNAVGSVSAPRPEKPGFVVDAAREADMFGLDADMKIELKFDPKNRRKK
jgi:predicted RNA-binding protein with PIN domain